MHGCRLFKYSLISVAYFLPCIAFSDIPDPSSFLSPTATNALVKTVGLNMDHRSYEPATALGMGLGLDIGLEVTLVQPPSDLGTALGGMSGSSSSSSLPILPSAKLHLHKGLGSRVDIGFSCLPPIPSLPYIGGSFLMGGDIKIVVWQAEEGPTWAVRTSYNVNNLVLSTSGTTVTVKTATITPQILISRKLSFADPYLGMGYQYTYGSVHAVIPIPEQPAPAPAIAPIELTQSGSGSGTFFFGGVGIRVPSAGFKITLEGAYSPLGMNYLGTKIGFQL